MKQRHDGIEATTEPQIANSAVIESQSLPNVRQELFS
jgi:hypothetical protein